MADSAMNSISNVIENGKEMKAAGNEVYAGKLAAKNIVEEHPELFAGMKKSEVKGTIKTLENVGVYTEQSDLVDNFDKIVKASKNGDDALTIANKISDNKKFGDLDIEKNQESQSAYYRKQIVEEQRRNPTGMSDADIKAETLRRCNKGRW